MAFHHALAILLAALVVGSPAGAEPVRKWRAPDGRVHLGDRPPVGSVPMGESADSEEAPDIAPGPEADVSDAAADDEGRFSVDVSLRRRAIEKNLKAAAERLSAVRSATRDAEEARLEGRYYALATEEDVAEAANFQAEKARRLEELRKEESATVAEIGALRSEFERLRAEVAERYGGSPPAWWRDTLSCPKCPAP